MGYQNRALYILAAKLARFLQSFMIHCPVTVELIVSTIDIGRRGEQSAVEYLTRVGFQLVETNYRRRNCEIDIVARKLDCIFFVEVKYRATSRFGSGFDYITSSKLHHMRRAAAMWVKEHDWRGAYTLSAIEISGATFDEINFIESVY